MACFGLLVLTSSSYKYGSLLMYTPW